MPNQAQKRKLACLLACLRACVLARLLACLLAIQRMCAQWSVHLDLDDLWGSVQVVCASSSALCKQRGFGLHEQVRWFQVLALHTQQARSRMCVHVTLS